MELRVIMEDPAFDLQVETQKTLCRHISGRLQLEGFPKEKRSVLKDLILRMVEESEKGKTGTDTHSLSMIQVCYNVITVFSSIKRTVLVQGPR